MTEKDTALYFWSRFNPNDTPLNRTTWLREMLHMIRAVRESCLDIPLHPTFSAINHDHFRTTMSFCTLSSSYSQLDKIYHPP
jgi:hypothetical protein